MSEVMLMRELCALADAFECQIIWLAIQRYAYLENLGDRCNYFTHCKPGGIGATTKQRHDQDIKILVIGHT